MRLAPRTMLLAWLSVYAAACEGREVAVFELPGATPSAGASAAGGGAGGMLQSPSLAGVSNGGAVAGGGSSGASSDSSGSAGASGGGGTGGAAGASGDPTRPCQGDDDCGPGWVCEKPGCNALIGQCVPWPAICLGDPRPVCGCDGITYWNDCIRLNAPRHTQLAAPDPCRASACSCEVGSDCKVPYASCSHLVAPGSLCGHGPGACWVLPTTCTPSADKKLWRECKLPDQGPPGPCVDTCTAIASERSYVELHRGDTCY